MNILDIFGGIQRILLILLGVLIIVIGVALIIGGNKKVLELAGDAANLVPGGKIAEAVT